MSIAGPAYIAAKSKTNGWIDPTTATNAGLTALPIQSAADKDFEGPPSGGYYAPVRSAKGRVAREYGGINSSGGPQVSGRSDQSDFQIQMNSGGLSPILYEHCCSGVQLSWVHLAVLAADDSLVMHIRMQDVNVTGYKFSGALRFQNDFYFPAGTSSISMAGGFSRLQDSTFYGVLHLDNFTLLYTSISYFYGTTGRGWNTGADRQWTPA